MEIYLEQCIIDRWLESGNGATYHINECFDSKESAGTIYWKSGTLGWDVYLYFIDV